MEKNIEQIKTYAKSEEDTNKIESFVKNLKSSLKESNFLSNKQYLIDSLKLDDGYNYSPYIPGYDVYNGVSASDNVRIILAYYFSLLKTSIELGDKTRFLNLLILDEPKQQNIDEEAFESFLQQTKSIPSEDWQVIITTFRGEEKLKDFNVIKISSDESKFLIKKL